MDKRSQNIRKNKRTVSFGMLFIVLAILGMSMYVSLQFRELLINQAKAQFSTEADRLTVGVVTGVNRYTDLLYQGRSFLYSSQHVTQQEWTMFFESQQALQRFAGVNSITYLDHFQESEKDSFLKKMRNEPYFGGKSFTVKPGSHPNGEYAVVALNISRDDLSKAFGFNVLSDPVRRAVYQAANSRDNPQASAPTLLKTGYKGFYVVLPVRDMDSADSERVDGYVLVSFHSSEIIKHLFKGNSTIASYRVVDTTNSDNPISLFQSPHWDENLPFNQSNTFSFGERKWTISYTSKNNYENQIAVNLLPSLIILVGVIFSFLITYIMYSVRNSIRTQKN